ncbi:MULTISPECIES: glucose 1-dehydrogenase [unclassified Mesorhizobium]|uniref:SDR family NAD(P)-dependent oxidoreductase n=1 Tax=unclassified Mesorhizobium TaxID=325217 RepID=UPI000FDB846C|nr:MULTISPECIES: glucose 1-dehydrogenase [unclassified Mesorhizobium]TGR22985.1 glucose 1-dehydrogenase [Mesorhizobium sp. M8A.F.Ca.ET.197.01.1.1]TGR39069.1 glucose 1-dehydrogenase [bacterium M00.F.Ca.ET.199.01.1.1]TGR46663.1 glucose 1-dehydrogenase [Mesorhizobium sp. M8A.F.Ca.ET.198.01.1.1]TGV85263.1 glucose 1-dehydrogenase [Mesorhizobium sp. M00.F.Ca.ET.149.01.1.1]
MTVGTAEQVAPEIEVPAEARNFSVQDRVVIVTGAGQGIGRELARQFAAAGAIPVIADLALENAKSVAKEITASGGKALPLAVDVAKKDSVGEMVAATLAKFGRVDVLINNASLFSNLAKRPFDQIPEAEWQRVMDVNINGVFFCASAVVGSMRKNRFGRIINISSDSVHRGTKNYLHYVTSKSALIGMTNSLARELGPEGITVNCIRPGTVATEVAERAASLTPEVRQRSIDLQCIPRTIVPSDLAGLAMFLSTPAASFITGQTIACDGGYTHSF